jgi:hypothetical protein
MRPCGIRNSRERPSRWKTIGDGINSFPELFIKNADTFITSAISGSYPDIAEKAF